MTRAIALVLIGVAACASAPHDGPFERGVRAQAAGRLRDAVDEYRKAVARDGGDEDAWFNLGTVWQELGDVARAGAAYRRAIRANPRAADALCNLALVLQGEGKHAEARSTLERAASVAPHRAFPLVLLARLSKNGKAELLEAALEAEPSSAIAHLEAARLYRTSDKARALDHAEKALDADGDSGVAARLLAEIALESGDAATASLAARRLAAIATDSAPAFGLLARSYEASGRLTQALWAAMQAERLAPADATRTAYVKALLARIVKSSR